MKSGRTPLSPPLMVLPLLFVPLLTEGSSPATLQEGIDLLLNRFSIPPSFCITGMAVRIIGGEGGEAGMEYLDLMNPRYYRSMESPPFRNRAGKEVCEGYYYQNREESTNFAAEWEDDSISSGDIDDLLDYLEESWDVEVGDLNYNEPEGSDDYLIEVFIDPIGWEGAFTTTYYGCGYNLPYIVIDPSILEDDDWMMDIAAHEFFHTIQFGYYAFYEDFWWWEASSTWMEDVVYPETNIYAETIYFYSNYPYLSIDFENYAHEYGMCIFAKYLEEYRGGVDTIWETWEEAYDDPYEDFEDILTGIMGGSLPLDTLFADFTARNSVMDYDEGEIYENVSLTDIHTSYPVDEEEDGGDLPQFCGTSYILFLPESGDIENVLYLGFDGDESVRGKTVEWAVSVTEVREGGDYEFRKMDLDSDARGSIRVDNWGDGVEKAYLSLSPVTDFKDDEEGASYRYMSSYEEIEFTDPGNGDDDDDDEGVTRLSDISRGGYPSCSCSIPKGGEGGWGAPLLLIIPLLPLFRRAPFTAIL